MKPFLAAAAILLLAGTEASAHRLDEYLEGTLISVGKSSISAQLTLTPGVSVFPLVIADIDTNSDGVISKAEQSAYAGRVLRDLSLALDGRPLTPRLLSARFPAIEEMREGRGEIRIEFETELPHGGTHRRFTLENRHENRIAAYQVNCLVPSDPDIKILSQNRNYSQSLYELEFVQAGASWNPLSPSAWFPITEKPLGTAVFLLLACLALIAIRHFSHQRWSKSMDADRVH